jgi:4-amino-4-deoxy-L-arabinose transferase-like glycosyltransferase
MLARHWHWSKARRVITNVDPDPSPMRRPMGPMTAFFILLMVLLVARVVTLVLSPFELGPDEAQYWQWSRTLELGYFSKPPMIAWAMWFTTAIFGNEEWAVRLSAPFLHSLTAILLALAARRVAGEVAGAWAGALWLTMPVVWLSSGILTTDVLLMPGWSFAIYALVRVLEARRAGSPSLKWAFLMGIGIGIGALAKYAALYFVGGLAISMLLSADIRRILLGKAGLVVIAGIALAMAPNLFWNWQHSFSTVEHTVANANLGAEMGGFGEVTEFLLSQFVVIGPFALGGFIAVVATWKKRFPDGLDDYKALRLVLLVLALLPVAAITVQAFVSRANSNWAATAFPAMILLAAIGLSSVRWGRILLVTGLTFQLVFGAAFIMLAVSPRLVDDAGLSNGVKRARGWQETADAVHDRLKSGDYTAVLVDSRLVYHQLIYYGRNWTVPITVWRRYSEPQNHAETVAPLTNEAAGRVLIVALSDEPGALLSDFATASPQPAISVRLDKKRSRTFQVFEATGWSPRPKPPRQPQSPDRDG